MNMPSIKRLLANILGMLFMLQSVHGQDVSVSRSTNIDSDNGTMRWKTSSGFNSFNVEFRGKIEIENDDRDIASMSDGAYLEISKAVFGSKRTIVIESIGGGKFKKQYYEGRSMVNWEPEGREWLAEILPEVVRTTTFCAESRVKRFFKQGGTNAVLAEINRIESDYVKSHYATLLLKQPVQVKDYAPIINNLAEGLDSDHYLTEFLKGNTSKFMQDKDATSALFSATRKMDSDHYKTEVIKEALKGQVASIENVKIILQAAGMMESDHYITEVLTSLLKQNNLNDAILAEIINTTNSIESDHYRTLVLTQALDKQGLSTISYQRVIESIKGIESDHYVTEVIKHMMNTKLSDESLTLMLSITNSIESDHYRTEVIRLLLNKQNLTETQFTKLLESCNLMDSDHYKTVVLQEALASNSITNTKLASIINATNHIGSDHYITEVLTDAAPKVKAGGSELKELYRTAAKRIQSETYYGRAIRAIE